MHPRTSSFFFFSPPPLSSLFVTSLLDPVETPARRHGQFAGTGVEGDDSRLEYRVFVGEELCPRQVEREIV
jgi:hypothetical protein